MLFVLPIERLRGECDKEKKAREEVFTTKRTCVFCVIRFKYITVGFDTNLFHVRDVFVRHHGLSFYTHMNSEWFGSDYGVTVNFKLPHFN